MEWSMLKINKNDDFTQHIQLGRSKNRCTETFWLFSNQ